MVAVLALTLVAAVGCAKSVPSGVDKDLVNGWAMMAEAKVPEPEAGACWTSSAGDVDKIVSVPVATTAVPCTDKHSIETVLVGHFTGAAADGDLPPTLDRMADTYAACDAEVTKFLGGSWQLGRVRMLVYPPTATQWRGGARFYRCDVASLTGISGAIEDRTASLQGSLRAGGDRLHGCAVMDGGIDKWTEMTPAACTAPHDAEFMGLITSKSGAWPADKTAAKAAFDTACVDKIRTFTGGAINALANAKAQYWYPRVASSAEEWSAGNHNAHCFVMLPKKISRSLKGNGSKAV
ncbi:septum formation family protein [Dactylosporangium sp. NPDC005555]|uniref:septum formation family protein n=1 Tax=Dactylosporangium sp. NPDC005555 TaxID=3154889 RepID=UPI0033A79E96